MIEVAENPFLQRTEEIDVAQFREEPSLGNGIPLAIQLKGHNRMDRIKRRNDQNSQGRSGSVKDRPISIGAVMAINDLSGLDFLSADNLEYKLDLPDSRGIAALGNDIYFGSVDKIYHINVQNRTKSTLVHPWFAFIHSLQLTEDGKRILVTSPGFDRIIELDTNVGDPTWEWSAWDHGYNLTVSSHKRIVTDTDSAKLDNTLLVRNPSDYPKGLGLPPGDRTAFPNSAIYLDERTLLVTLFHGGLIEIDRETGNVTPVLNGLSHPHGVRKYKSGYIVADTAHGACIFLNENLRVFKKLAFFNLPDKAEEAESLEWLQNVVPINNDLLAAIDSNRASIYIVDPDNQLKRRISYDPNWVMQEVCPLSSELIKGLSALSPAS